MSKQSLIITTLLYQKILEQSENEIFLKADFSF